MEIERFKKLLSEAQKHQQPQRERTFFDTAIRKHYENPTTELLSYFLNPENDHGLGSVFFDGLTDAINALNPFAEADDYGAVKKVSTEVPTISNKRIDLLVESDRAVFLIESKIYHSQTNPFEEYEQHIATNFSALKPFKIVFCIDGKTAVKDWIGVSFSRYVSHVNTFLSQAMLKNPYNKWALLAREFLIHLENFEKNIMNNTSLNFVQENYKDISALIQLKENFISEICSQVNSNLEMAIEGYEPYQSRITWNIKNQKFDALYFSNKKWEKIDSAAVIALQVDTQPVTCSIYLSLDHQTDDLKAKIKENLNADMVKTFNYEESVGKNNQEWWFGCENIEFDLNKFIDFVIEINKTLQLAETVWRHEEVKQA